MPPPSASRLVLAVLAMGAAALFSSSWFFVQGPSYTTRASAACVEETVGSTELVDAFLRCTAAAHVREGLLLLSGPGALVVLAVTGWLLAPALLARWWCTRPLSGPLCRELDAIAAQAGVPPPEWCAGRVRGARTFGRRGRFRVVFPERTLFATSRLGIGPIRSDTAHELGHLRNRDVDRTYLTLAAGAAFAMLFAGPLVVGMIRRDVDVGVALTWRLVVLLAAVFLSVAAVLRAREHDADLRAGTHERDALRTALDRTAERAAGHSSRLPPAVRVHPSARARRDVLDNPARVMRTSPVECLSVGAAAGVVMVELPVALLELLDTVATGSVVAYVVAYVVAAGPVGLAVVGVVGISGWRATSAARLGLAPQPGVFGPGLALGAGLLIGSQVAPRSSALWSTEFAGAGDRAFSPGLVNQDPGTRAWLVMVVLLIGLFVVAWSCAAAPDRPVARPVSRTTLIGLLARDTAIVVLPLGGWFYAQRSAASGATPAVVLRVLGGPVVPLVVALLVVALLATIVLGGRSGRRRASITTTVAVLGTAALIASPALASGPTIQPALEPPSSRQVALTCVWLRFVGTGDGPEARRRLGRLLQATDDALARAIGAEIVTTADATGRASAGRALAALVRRCDAFGAPR